VRDSQTGFRLMESFEYLEFLNLMANARLALADSGGIQE
jgi:UDP-N-acetylglucosamine 2-epimerase